MKEIDNRRGKVEVWAQIKAHMYANPTAVDSNPISRIAAAAHTASIDLTRVTTDPTSNPDAEANAFARVYGELRSMYEEVIARAPIYVLKESLVHVTGLRWEVEA